MLQNEGFKLFFPEIFFVLVFTTVYKAVFGRNKKGGIEFLSKNKGAKNFISEKNQGAKNFDYRKEGGNFLQIDFSQNPA